VSLVLDNGAVFTGDLTHPALAGEGTAADVVMASWDRLRAKGAKQVHPGHGPVRSI
jgi:glyoxylase-like metal-dependent hydrolase (beta-lactamase superfamily II)